MQVQLSINQKTQCLDIDPQETLLALLRKLGLQGTKKGCEEGTCGTCVVLIDNVPHYACLLLAVRLEGASITTIEGLTSTQDTPHPIIQAFAEEGAVQCGYCIPSMVLATKVLLDDNLNPTHEEIKDTLDGHLCRCTGYVKQFKAINTAAKKLRALQESKQ